MNDSLCAVHFVTLLFSLCSATAACGQARPSSGMMRYPDVSHDRIAFVYADDIWTVPRQGGTATPLASPAGPERFPRFQSRWSNHRLPGELRRWTGYLYDSCQRRDG